MSDAALPRRGFLRGLVSLPLIGGGVTLIGKPTAAAVPATRELLETYKAWLFAENVWLGEELYPYRKQSHLVMPCGNPGARWHGIFSGWDAAPRASSRAAVVLSAVGCPLGGPSS